MDERATLLDEFVRAIAAQRSWQARRAEIGDSSPVPQELARAAMTTSYYSRRVTRDAGHIESYPVTPNAEMRANPELFAAYREGPASIVRTSGTTGKPCEIAYDEGANHALFYGWIDQILERHLVTAGAITAGSTAIALVTTKPGELEICALPTAPLAFYRKFVIARTVADREVIDKLLACTPVIVHGKPSYLLALADRMSGLGLDPRALQPKLMVCSGETLFEDMRERIEQAFGALVVGAYACGEGGMIALECSRRKGLHVFAQRAYVEVRVAGMVAPVGTGEIVLTNRFNFATPVIRCAMGDHATLRRVTCGCGFEGLTLFDVWGREPPALHGPGGHTFRSSDLGEFVLGEGVSDFQITMSSEGAAILFAGDDPDEGVPALRAAFERGFGVPVDVRRVPSLPRIGSKHRRFIQIEPETEDGTESPAQQRV